MNARWMLATSLLAGACTAGGGATGGASGGSMGGMEQAAPPMAGAGSMPAAAPAPPAAITADHAQEYARRLVPMLAGRTLTAAEVTRLRADGETALRPLIESWVEDARFADSARTMIALKLRASGKTGATDLDLPGNLAAFLVKNKRPWSEIITAEQCADAKGMPAPCDTGAPYGAGVLATRAFLIGNVGRFNLRRARTVMQTFACLDYPMDAQIQPRLPKEMLQPMFQADTASEQTVEAARGTFGNGHACYTCHSQFGAHAQLFVKFDETGKWRETATGIQDPKGEPGRSTGGLYASHMLKPADAASEATQMFGKRVANLNEAARAIADSAQFLPCQTKMLIGYAFSLPDSAASDMPEALIAEIVAAARTREPAPSLAALAVSAFTHPSVIRSIQPR